MLMLISILIEAITVIYYSTSSYSVVPTIWLITRFTWEIQG